MIIFYFIQIYFHINIFTTYVKKHRLALGLAAQRFITFYIIYHFVIYSYLMLQFSKQAHVC